MTPLYRFKVVLGFVSEAYRGGKVAASTAGPTATVRAGPLLLPRPRPVPVPPLRTFPSPLRALALVLAAILTATPAVAQTPERSTRFDRALPSTSATQERPLMHCDATGPCVVPTTLGALGGAGLGALAGGGALLVYALVAGGVDSDDGGPGMLALGGALVGAGIGMPLGAHLANRERGSLVLDFVVPVAATALAGRVAQEAGVRVGIVIPVTALVSVVATEIITGR